jgi:uncharacterized protein (DUF305 family)
VKGSTLRALAAAVLGAASAACGAGARAPSPEPASVSPAASRDDPAPAPAAADVRFMQRMIAHHGQALTMTALVPARTEREDLRLVAERIAISQRNEIALMRRWLQRHGAAVPDSSAHGGHGADAAGQAAAMPGMLTDAELSRLSSASGPAFERLFLELMIRHHEGALAMVAELLATPGAAQDTEVFRLASDVDADQRAEIRRLRSLLDRPPDGPRRR